ncbi:hypothetical protein MRB53_023682 [Persea americana]|uniref:Uncharacterized protein n=1 Tax=Persea americana TaxID=3435 RepID=A0ACC2LBD5_PERAE|nr:hypothetical protein MRB53_023682 [Persea americana]
MGESLHGAFYFYPRLLSKRNRKEIQSLSRKEEKTQRGGILQAEGRERLVFCSLLAKTNRTRCIELSKPLTNLRLPQGFLQIDEYPPDANRGFDIPSALISFPDLK